MTPRYQTPEYKAWRAAIDRCTLPHHQAWENYGGRGIRVCDRWLESFEAFLADVGPRPGKDYSLDRKENDGHYEPGNVRWATLAEQNRNRRDSVKLTLDGVTMNASEWARRLGISKSALGRRIKVGWPLHRALTQGPSTASDRSASGKAWWNTNWHEKPKRERIPRDWMGGIEKRRQLRAVQGEQQ